MTHSTTFCMVIKLDHTVARPRLFVTGTLTCGLFVVANLLVIVNTVYLSVVRHCAMGDKKDIRPVKPIYSNLLLFLNIWIYLLSFFLHI